MSVPFNKQRFVDARLWRLFLFSIWNNMMRNLGVATWQTVRVGRLVYCPFSSDEREFAPSEKKKRLTVTHCLPMLPSEPLFAFINSSILPISPCNENTVDYCQKLSPLFLALLSLCTFPVGGWTPDDKNKETDFGVMLAFPGLNPTVKRSRQEEAIPLQAKNTRAESADQKLLSIPGYLNPLPISKIIVSSTAQSCEKLSIIFFSSEMLAHHFRWDLVSYGSRSITAGCVIYLAITAGPAKQRKSQFAVYNVFASVWTWSIESNDAWSNAMQIGTKRVYWTPPQFARH